MRVPVPTRKVTVMSVSDQGARVGAAGETLRQVRAPEALQVSVGVFVAPPLFQAVKVTCWMVLDSNVTDASPGVMTVG